MKDIDKQRYEEMKKKSTTGENVQRTRKKVGMSRKEYVKRVKAIIAATSVTTLLSIGAASSLIGSIRDTMTLNKTIYDFKKEVIAPETHPTDDYAHYYYDYSDIAQKLEEAEDFNQAVYLLNENIGDYQTGQVLYHTEYGSFTNYKEEKGYASTDEFKKDMKKQVLLTEEIKDKERELEEMKQEHQASTKVAETDLVDGMGGK